MTGGVFNSFIMVKPFNNPNGYSVLFLHEFNFCFFLQSEISTKPSKVMLSLVLN
jgi:hypothetical protein